MSQFQLTPHQARYYSWLLTRQAEGGSMDSLATTLVDAQVDLNSHQVDAALFACKNPLSKGVILADEVGLGKTIEAGFVILQHWAERKQWHEELQEKFGLQGMILEDAKKRALLTALSTAFAKLKELGAKQKSYYFYRIQTRPSLSLRMSCSNRLHADNSEKPLRLPTRIAETTIKTRFQTSLSDNIAERRQTLLNQATERNLGYFEEEVQKLDDWADDLKQGLEQEIKETDREIKEVRRTSATSATLEEKLSW